MTSIVASPIHSVLENFWGPSVASIDRRYSPNIEIKKGAEAYYVTALLPGVRSEDLSVKVEGGELEISGRFAPREREGYSALYSELGSSEQFYRSLPLDERAFEVDKVEAELKDGALHITLPLSKQAKPRQIDIKVR